MTASATDVLAALRDAPEPDGVGATSVDEDATTVGLDLSLGAGWFVIDVADAGRRNAQIAELIDRQFAAVTVQRALRDDLARWLREASTKSAAAGGRFLAFLLQRTDEAAVALNVTLYWHELGPVIGDESHLERVTAQLRADLRQGDELLGADTAAGPLARYARVRSGAEELQASEVPMLLLDYWLEFPDGRGLALLSFSSPHVDLREHLGRLADAIVLEGRWVLEPAG